MKYIDKKIFWNKLKQKFSIRPNEFFYNSLDEYFNCKGYTISRTAKLDTLIKRTLQIPKILGNKYPLVIFNNECSGWKGIKKYKYLPIEIGSSKELKEILRNRIYFREEYDKFGERYDNNYHITNKDFEWFIIFCHHDDWHFYAKPSLVTKIKDKLTHNKAIQLTLLRRQ